MKAYQDLKQSFQRLHYLSKTIALLDWDHETYLPRKGVGYRADQRLPEWSGTRTAHIQPSGY